jgi:hypothetical protein
MPGHRRFKRNTNVRDRTAGSNVTAWITAEDLMALEARAEALNVSKSELLRMAIRELLKSREGVL